MKETLRKDILTETYKDVQKLIYATAWNFWKIHGGDVEDLVAQANLIFIDAFDTYDSNKSKLTTWLTFKIRKGLFRYMKKEVLRRRNGIAIDDRLVESIPTRKRDISVMDFLDELNSDAIVVLQMFLETPRDILVDMLNRHGRIDGVRAHLKMRLGNRLRQMGWGTSRIKRAFEIIKSVSSY